MKITKKTDQKGFTIVELMIATTVFSVLLLVCLSALMYIGRLYYKGITKARNQEVTRTTIDSVSQSIQFSGREVTGVSNLGTGGWTGAYCIGNQKYSYKKNTQLVFGRTGDSLSDQVLVKSTDSACASSTTATPTNNGAQELLGEDMRLLAFEITPAGPDGLPYSNLYDVTVSVAFGGQADGDDEEVFNLDSDQNIIGCKSGETGSEFCDVSSLSTTVFRKVQ